MKLTETKIKDVYIVEPQVFNDERGWFMETYSARKTPEIACDFVQDNQSYSKGKGILRGIHFQNGEHAQAKLVRVVRGAVLDVAVELSEENKKQLFIPRGFGHGFVTLSDDVEFVYKTDNYYNHESDRSIKFDDPEIGVEWGIANPILSEKDKKAPLLKDSDCTFIYK